VIFDNVLYIQKLINKKKKNHEQFHILIFLYARSIFTAVFSHVIQFLINGRARRDVKIFKRSEKI